MFLILLSKEKWFPAAFILMRFWAKWLCVAAAVFPKIKKEKDWKEIPEPCVYVANHTSYLDIVLSYVTIPRYFIFIGKQELDNAPLFRILFKRMNILVNRKSAIDSHKAFLRANEEIIKGKSIFIFPEATISPDGILMGFKNGAFKLAIDRQVPVVPIIFCNNWKLLKSGGFLTATGRPGTARVIIKSPVSTNNMKEEDLISLREHVRNIIEQALSDNP
jgi:1-acyl-sn-glycerol-3-phosphate acyltransferase